MLPLGGQFCSAGDKAKGVDIAARIDIPKRSFRLFRAHVFGCSDQYAQRGMQRSFSEFLVDRFGNPKIDDLDLRRVIDLRHQDIGGLEVPMNDAFVVCVLDRVTDLGEKREPFS